MCQMLRFLLPLIVATLLTAAVVQAEEDESISMEDVLLAMESFASNCDPVPTREQMEEMVLNKKEAQRETKCFRFCLMSQFDLVTEGNTQMDKEKAKGLLEMIMPDNEAAAIEIIDTCNQKNAAITEKCEAAHEHGMCIFDELTARDVKMPNIKQ